MNVFKMAMSQTAKADDVKDAFAPVPRGNYLLRIERLEFKPNKQQTGYLINAGFVFKTRRWIWHCFNILNQSERAQEIGQQHFKMLCTALNINPEDIDEENLSQFEGQFVEAYVSIDRSNQNVIRSFGATEETFGAPPPPPPLATQTGAMPAGVDDFEDDIPF